MSKFFVQFFLVLVLISCSSKDLDYVKDPLYVNGGVGTSSDRGAVFVRYDKTSCTSCNNYIEVNLNGTVVSLKTDQQTHLFEYLNPNHYNLSVKHYKVSDTNIGRSFSFDLSGQKNYTAWYSTPQGYYLARNTNKGIAVKASQTASVVIISDN